MFKVGDKVRERASSELVTGVDTLASETAQIIETNNSGFWSIAEDYELAPQADDAEPITREWLLTLPGWTLDGISVVHDESAIAWYQRAGILWLGNSSLPRIKTRGQLRQLLELIGDDE